MAIDPLKALAILAKAKPILEAMVKMINELEEKGEWPSNDEIDGIIFDDASDYLKKRKPK